MSAIGKQANGAIEVAHVRQTIHDEQDAHQLSFWCGAALSHNRASSEERWRAFIESVPIVGEKTLRITA